MTPLDELVAAWEAWDDKPGSRDRVVRRQDAARAVGLDSLESQRRVQALRREGLSVREAIERAAQEAST